MSNLIKFNIINGVPPFEAELIGSSLPKQIFNSIGQHYFYNVLNGYYTLKITDANGCIYEQEIIVDPSISTTTTTIIPEESIIVGHAQDPLLIFNPVATNKNGDFTGYPDSDVVTLYLWFKTYNGKSLTKNVAISYNIETTGGTADSTFEFNSVSDEVHTEVQEDIIGPNDSIIGNIILKKGFIESYFEYTYYRGSTNKRYQIELKSGLDDFYPNSETSDEAGTDYGISIIDTNEIIFNY
jgi:hypothetical protein